MRKPHRSQAYRPFIVGVTTAVTIFFLLARFLGSPVFSSTSHAHYDLGFSASSSDSIYLRQRHAPKRLTRDEVRREQDEAFFELYPLTINKVELEAMVGRRLPWASDILLEDINYGRSEEVSEGRRHDRVIHFVTPTYLRSTQMIDLLRMSQTLQAAAYSQMGIIHWVVIEDAPYPTQRVRSLLQRSGLPYSHVAIQSRKTTWAERNATIPPGRGAAQRNAGLEVVRDMNVDGVIYFADDDNAYDIQLVTELTRTKSVSAFGVGLVGNGSYERCHVDEATGLVDRFISGWDKPRKYGIDQAGFAFSTAWDIYKNSIAKFDIYGKAGTLENDFLDQLVSDPSEFQPLAADCTKILAWHTHTCIKKLNYHHEITHDPDWMYITALV